MISRVLRHRNYRLFFCGQSVSLIGTWLTRTATSWLVYRLSHSALILGLVNFASLIPLFLLTPIAGVYVDRWNKHRVLVITQICSAIQSVGLAVLTLTGTISVPFVLALNVFQGLINAFDVPTRQSFVIQMIEDREDLPQAIALNSSMVNLARLVGPSCAGILIAVSGEGGCFTIDAISYLAVIATLLMMKLPPWTPSLVAHKRVLVDLKEGVEYAIRSPIIISVLCLFALVSFMGVPYITLLPVIVHDRLGGDARDLGYLTAASGCGALAGVLTLGSRKSRSGLERIISISALGFGVGLILFGFSHGFWLSIAMMVGTGMGMMVQTAASNTALQTTVEEGKRGRIMSLFAMAYGGMAPFGSLFGGFIADRIGAAATFKWGGAAVCVGALLFYRTLRKRQLLGPVVTTA